MGLKEEMEKLTQRGRQKQMSSEEMSKTYFSIALPKGVSVMEKTIRILPGEKIFHVGYFHEIYVGGSKNKIYDPGYNDKEYSPLNEVAKKLEEKGTEEAKDLAKSYRPKKFYMVRVIERGREEDGPKWWRFKHDSRGTGIFDKILDIVQRRGDINDPDNGRDLTLTIKLNSYNNNEYSAVTNILPEDPSPLHTDKSILDKWLSDKSVWRNVYKPKPIEFLEILAAGETPKWDAEKEKYVVANKDMGSASYGRDDVETTKKTEEVKSKWVEEPTASKVVEDEIVDEDLPF